ncbi:MAG: hypothetical protein ACRDP6_11065 [Actinoallomurus sp.]
MTVLLTGCSSDTLHSPIIGSSSAGMSSPPHGRRDQITGAMLVDLDGRHLHQWRNCGGTLTAADGAAAVVLNYPPPSVPPGVGSCARVQISVYLKQPLRGRKLIDGYTGRPVPAFELGDLLKPAGCGCRK